MNCELPSLAEAAARYEEEAGAGEAWTILPSVTDNRDSLALYRGVDVEGFDIPCAKHATCFSVGVRVDSGRVPKPTEATLKNSQLAKDLADHADAGDEATREIVHEML